MNKNNIKKIITSSLIVSKLSSVLVEKHANEFKYSNLMVSSFFF